MNESNSPKFIQEEGDRLEQVRALKQSAEVEWEKKLTDTVSSDEYIALLDSAPKPLTEEQQSRLMGIIGASKPWTDPQEVILWLATPHTYLDGRTPFEILTTGDDSDLSKLDKLGDFIAYPELAPLPYNKPEN